MHIRAGILCTGGFSLFCFDDVTGCLKFLLKPFPHIKELSCRKATQSRSPFECLQHGRDRQVNTWYKGCRIVTVCAHDVCVFTPTGARQWCNTVNELAVWTCPIKVVCELNGLWKPKKRSQVPCTNNHGAYLRSGNCHCDITHWFVLQSWITFLFLP